MSEAIEVRLEYPEGHSKKQRLIMGAFQIPGVRKIYVACGTKFGKSLGASVCLSTPALTRPGTTWRWIAPIYEQALVGMGYFSKVLPPRPHSDIKPGAMRIWLPKAKSKIEFWHCKNPMSLEGPGINGNIFDEAAKCPYAAVASAQTTVTFTRGPQMYISTPLGKNWFHQECMAAKEEMEWAVQKGKTPSRIFIHARTEDNPFIDPAVIAEAKRDLTDRLYRQYYLAEFLDDGAVFIGFRDCVQGPLLDVAEGSVQTWIHPDAKEMDVFIGADWAKKEDFLVLTALRLVNGVPELVGFLRFQGVGYVDAMREVYRFKNNFKSVIVLHHDKTGVGEAIDDMLGQMDLNFEGVVFTNSSKAAMVNRLIVAFETGEIKLVNWPELLRELDNYTVVTNELGHSRYSAPKGFHDDIVSSLMLAYSACQDYAGEFKLQFLEDLADSAPKQTVESWYNKIRDDD